MTPGYVDVISDRHVNRAKQVVVALAPVLAGRIRYDLRCRRLRDGLTQRLPQGHLIKVQAIYERPFWRDDGLNGSSICDVGPVTVTYDSSPRSGTPGAVLGFVGGDEARAFTRLSAEARRRAALGGFVRVFGARALDPIAPPGVLTTYGRALREPVERLHWAGTESSTLWNGYMDGAVRSGERAAREVLGAL